jgi:hypothetical protein
MILSQTHGTRSTVLIGSTSRTAVARKPALPAQPERQPGAASCRKPRGTQAPGSGSARGQGVLVQSALRSALISARGRLPPQPHPAPLTPRTSAPRCSGASAPMATAQIGLVGLAVMGQVSCRASGDPAARTRPPGPTWDTSAPPAEPGAEHRGEGLSHRRLQQVVRQDRGRRAQGPEVGCVVHCSRSSSSSSSPVELRAGADGLTLRAAGLGDKLKGYKEIKDFVMSLERPRWGSHRTCTAVAPGPRHLTPRRRHAGV